MPLRWSYSCCMQRANQPGRVERDSVPVDVEADDAARDSPRLSGKASPGTDRQPSTSSCGSGSLLRRILEAVSVGLTTTPRAGTPSSLAICQMKTRSPTPICGAARPTPLAASMVSNMSATSSAELVVERRDEAAAGGGGRARP